MHLTSALSLIAALLTPLILANGIVVEDQALEGSCTGSSGCCIPVCGISVTGVGGCEESGFAQFLGTCRQNADRASKGEKLDLPNYKNCPNREIQWGMTWDKEAAMIIVRDKSTDGYDPFAVTNCKLATVGGGQCVPNGGGCDSQLIIDKRSAKFRI